MKKSMAVFLISGLILTVAGAITIITSVGMGVGEQIKNDINDAITEPQRSVTYEYEDVKKIDFEINAANVSISEGDTFSITYTEYNNSDFETYVDDSGTWHIDGSLYKPHKLFGMITRIKNIAEIPVYITIPSDYEMSDAYINVNAGNVEWQNINCKDCSIIASAGNVEISGDISGSINIEANMGNIEVYLTDDIENYNLAAKSNMGSVVINGKEYSGVSENVTVTNDADRDISLISNMGNVEIYFNR